MAVLDKLVKELGEDFKLRSNELETNVDIEASNIIFHLPLIVLIILVASSRKEIKFSVEDVSYWVTRVFLELYSNFSISEQQLRMSSVLRKRSVEGILFLESSDFILVVEDEGVRFIKFTTSGNDFLKTYIREKEMTGLIIGRINSALDRVLLKGNSFT